jgi:DNA polymerase (family X)
MQVVLPHGRAIADELALELVKRGARVEVVGDLRRGHELVDELTIVCDVAPSEAEHVLQADDLELVRSPGGLAGTLNLDHGPVPVRVRCTTVRGFVDAVLRESSSAAHVSALEARAEAMGTSLAAITAASVNEHAVYLALDLPYVPPELRDSESFEVPSLVTGLRGVFHAHTTWSDGVLGVAPMARAAMDRGLEYLGISDHTRAAYYANGLDPERLRDQRRDVAKARREVPGITILHGVECDILEDGTLDLPDAVLSDLDFVIASVHSHLDLTLEQQTARVVRALSHPLVVMLGHPTGRLLLGRDPIQIDLDRVAQAAAKHDVFLEINTTAQRLDLCADHARRAASFGAKFAINPDAHEPRGFDTLQFGILLARRARLAADQVLNTLSADQIRARLA